MSTQATDGYAGPSPEGLKLARPDESVQSQAPPSPDALRPYQKAILATTLAISALTGLAGTAGAAPLAAAQTISTQLQQTDIQVLKVLVLPQGTPRLDVIREQQVYGGHYDSDQRVVKEDYSQVGVNLGGGLFQDVEGNLSVVPFVTFGWDLTAHNFQRVDIGEKGQSVQRFGNTVHFTESSSKREVYTVKEGRVELQGPRGRTLFERQDDGSIHVKGPNKEYTVRQEGLYYKVEQAGQPDMTVLRTGDE